MNKGDRHLPVELELLLKKKTGVLGVEWHLVVILNIWGGIIIWDHLGSGIIMAFCYRFKLRVHLPKSKLADKIFSFSVSVPRKCRRFTRGR